MDFFKQKITDILKKETGLDNIPLEIPPDPKLGNFAFPCFELARKEQKNPAVIAEELARKISASAIIERAEAKGPYLNLFINKAYLTKTVLEQLLHKEKTPKKKQKILVESPGPNTNKPLHLGHLRNMALGISLSNLLRKTGAKVVNVDIINDRGIHICKSMLAYQKFGKSRKPNRKPDHFVGDFYVLYAKHEKELEQEVQEMLQKWEAGDKKIRALWKKMNAWALKGIRETYKRFGVKIDKPYYESQTYDKGKQIVLKGLEQGIFEKDEKGAIVVDLSDIGMDKKVLLRSDGTTVYITQDIYLAIKRYEDYKFDRLIHVVGSEQEHHFKALIGTFLRLSYPFAHSVYHFSYGMISLPEGKMKSREGTVVDADNLIDEVVSLAHAEVKKRNPKMKEKDAAKTAEIIGIGAIKFFILKYDPKTDFVYHPEESMSFEGETGPYVQYAHSRIKSILKKYGRKVSLKKANVSLLKNDKELELVTLLGRYRETVQEAAEQYKPHLVARLLLDISQAFNSFYHACPILQAEEEELKLARIALIQAVQWVLADGLGLLGIETPERM
ncbi:arginine--tRNA ligase [Candidatus Woesearchaeota archaeon]|nr:arginine--tRNA ligase [Candidatus Woesearchaeota archaeon]